MIDKRIKIRHIQAFVAICREKRMKAAAEKLSLTQPAITKTMNELEEILGAPLMERDRSGITLSPQGEVFLHFAQMTLASLHQGIDGVEQIGRESAARLRVGVLPSVAAWLMPEVTAEFYALSPGTVLDIVIGPHEYQMERLRLGDMDLMLGRMGRADTM